MTACSTTAASLVRCQWCLVAQSAAAADAGATFLQAAICPAFVSRPEGRKFLASLLTVHPSMVQEMTSVIRNQVSRLQPTVLVYTAHLAKL